MPRPSYPSDHRRWFRVYEDILDDPKLASVELRDVGAFIVLLATLNRQKSRDGIGFVSWRSAAALLRCQKRADVERVLGRLGAAGVLLYSGSVAGAEYRIPKWPELQGFAPALLRRYSGDTPSPIPTPTPTPKTSEKSMSPAPNGAEKPKVRIAKSDAPTDLDPEQKVALLAWVREKHPAEEPRIREHVDACLGFHRGKGNRMADWVATCQTWIRNAPRFAPRVNGARAKQDERAELLVENAAAAMRMAEEREQRERSERASRANRPTDPDVRRLPAGRDPLPH